MPAKPDTGGGGRRRQERGGAANPDPAQEPAPGGAAGGVDEDLIQVQIVPVEPGQEEEEEVPPAPAMAVNANQLAVLGEFKGEEEEDIELYTLMVDRCAIAFAWDDAITSQLVQTRLKGAAGRWLRSRIKTSVATDHLTRWTPAANVAQSGMRYALLTRFREGLNERGAVEAVSELKQRPTESVDEFYDRVVLAMDRKNYRATADEKDGVAYKTRLTDDVFTFFAAGLHEDVRLQALGGPTPPVTANTLLSAARNAELERKKNKKPKYLTELALDEEKETQGAAAALPGGDAMLSELRAEIDALKSTMSAVECWKCGKKGHISHYCPTAPSSQRGRARGRGYNFGRGRGGSSGSYFRPINMVRGRGAGGGATRGRGRPPGRRLYVLEGEGEMQQEPEYDLQEMTYDDGEEWYWSPNDQ
jgi:hypothetical protein